MKMQVTAEGLDVIASFVELMPQIATSAARMAINDTARRRAVPDAISAMREQVAFPPGYLQSPDRLGVTRFATEQNLEAVITGRQRPTSLARFSSGGRQGKAGLAVRVQPGRSRPLPRAFLIRLRGGADGSSNLGVAIRLKQGEAFRNKKIVASAWKGQGLYILYGPSVDQVFRTVAADISPDVVKNLEVEFLRQFARLSGGA